MTGIKMTGTATAWTVRRRVASAMVAALSGLLVLAACAGSGDADTRDDGGRNLGAEEANRALVVDFYDNFFNRHDVSAASVVADTYKQHNPLVPDGKKPFVDFFAGSFAQNPQSRSTIVRSATDGDLVYLHVHSVNGPGDRGQAVVDIFRVADGTIVEHWDVIQDVPSTSANPNSMF
ncbi:nuclear transport factor 2 family protein [Gordonia polyisoprenivorans]|uniref:nuclear transport factor 2 family protein n=1 Tax=Gordonia polyisoprenivorans TaxID=84595 RepID=UPI00230147E0|nr:nuclear transport factor 2 family protein [Gordonia polyisoprenivorans]WCB39278.1 nuclear transport factor 2 family protein [Gordonia polyisoprenivorans]